MRPILGCKPLCNLIPIDQVEEVAYEVWSLVPVVNLHAAQAVRQGTMFQFQDNIKGDHEEGEAHVVGMLCISMQINVNSTLQEKAYIAHARNATAAASSPQTSMVSRGVWLLGTGFSALGVLVTASLSPSLTSQAQPEPADNRGGAQSSSNGPQSSAAVPIPN